MNVYLITFSVKQSKVKKKEKQVYGEVKND